MKRAVLTITVGAFAFLAAFVVPGVGFWSFLFAVSGGPAFTARPDWKGDARLGIYMRTILAALNALGFALVTTGSGAWKSRGLARIALPSAVSGAGARVLSGSELWVLPTMAFHALFGAYVALGMGRASPGFLETRSP